MKNILQLSRTLPFDVSFLGTALMWTA